MAFSEDGRYAAFASTSSDLVPGDTNDGDDIFLYDLGDFDGDGMPSTWEAALGLDPADATDGAADPDRDGVPSAAEYAAGSHPRGLPAATRYFAEGATSPLFTTRFSLFNPDAAATAHVVLRFQKANGTSVSRTVAVGPRQIQIVGVGDASAMDDAAFATVVESDVAVVIDRRMWWDGLTGYGAHAETGVRSPALTWYFTEGATHGGFDLFYLLQNPGNTEARVRVQYLLPSGLPLEKTYVVAPHSRFNVWVDVEEFPGLPEPRALAATDVAVVIEVLNGVPIVAERAMYMSSPGRQFEAGHASAGVSAPSTEWYFAEGATGEFFDLFILIANPNPVAAHVTVTFLFDDGATCTTAATVEAWARANLWVDSLVVPACSRSLADAAVSMIVTADVPVLAERTMWWPGPTAATWAEAHNAFGATGTGTTWAFADGEQNTPRGMETYILIANASSYAGTARLTLYEEDGTTTGRDVDLPASSRVTVAVGPPTNAGGLGVTDHRFGAVVESLPVGGQEGPAQIVVERALYASASKGAFWAAGSALLATRIH